MPRTFQISLSMTVILILLAMSLHPSTVLSFLLMSFLGPWGPTLKLLFIDIEYPLSDIEHLHVKHLHYNFKRSKRYIPRASSVDQLRYNFKRRKRRKRWESHNTIAVIIASCRLVDSSHCRYRCHLQTSQARHIGIFSYIAVTVISPSLSLSSSLAVAVFSLSLSLLLSSSLASGGDLRTGHFVHLGECHGT